MKITVTESTILENRIMLGFSDVENEETMSFGITYEKKVVPALIVALEKAVEDLKKL